MKTSKSVALLVLAGIGALAVAALLVSPQRASADLMLMKIDGPKSCPAGLTITTKPVDHGMLQFDVSVDCDAIANNELYKGRAHANAVLQIASATERIATVALHGYPVGKDKRQTGFQLTLSPTAAKTSELQLGVSLYEKDGHPTLGGGRSLQIALGEFAVDAGSRKDNELRVDAGVDYAAVVVRLGALHIAFM